MTPAKDIISGCAATIQALRVHSSSSLSINHLEILFYIYLNDGITRQKLLERIPNVSPSTIKRHIKELCEVSWSKDYSSKIKHFGHNLIIETDDENDFRIKHLHLNEKGHLIIKTVVHKMQDCADDLPEGFELNSYTHEERY